jgi:hypothetical protein
VFATLLKKQGEFVESGCLHWLGIVDHDMVPFLKTYVTKRFNKGRSRAIIAKGKRAPKARGKAPKPPAPRKQRVRRARSGGGKRQGLLAHWGGKAGAWLGNLAQNGIQRILGMGDYSISPEQGVSSNTLINPDQGIPQMHMDSYGAIRVSHREFLTDVSGATTGQRAAWVLNPGDAKVFPWLSGIAGNFTQYKLLGLCFEFKSTSGDAVSSTNSALGSVSFATQYDVTAPLLASKQQFLNHFWSGSAKPSVDQMHCIECEPSVTPVAPLYIRTPSLGAVVSTGTFTGYTAQEMTDARLFDHARTEMLIIGQQANFVVGEVWITYDVLLLKPRLGLPGSGNTFDAPPSVYADSIPTYNHYPEVPLSFVLPIADAGYPTALSGVDEKAGP